MIFESSPYLSLAWEEIMQICENTKSRLRSDNIIAENPENFSIGTTANDKWITQIFISTDHTRYSHDPQIACEILSLALD